MAAGSSFKTTLENEILLIVISDLMVDKLYTMPLRHFPWHYKYDEI